MSINDSSLGPNFNFNQNMPSEPEVSDEEKELLKQLAEADNELNSKQNAVDDASKQINNGLEKIKNGSQGLIAAQAKINEGSTLYAESVVVQSEGVNQTSLGKEQQTEGLHQEKGAVEGTKVEFGQQIGIVTQSSGKLEGLSKIARGYVLDMTQPQRADGVVVCHFIEGVHNPKDLLMAHGDDDMLHVLEHAVDHVDQDPKHALLRQQIANRQIPVFIVDPNDARRLHVVDLSRVSRTIVSAESSSLLRQAIVTNQVALRTMKALQLLERNRDEAAKQEKSRLEADQRRPTGMDKHSATHLDASKSEGIPLKDTLRDASQNIARLQKELALAMLQSQSLRNRNLHRESSKCDKKFKEAIIRKEEIKVESIAAEAKKTEAVKDGVKASGLKQYKFTETHLSITGGTEKESITRDESKIISVHTLFTSHVDQEDVGDSEHNTAQTKHDIRNAPSHHADYLVNARTFG